MVKFSKILDSDDRLGCEDSSRVPCKLFNNFATTEMLDHEYSNPNLSSLMWSEMEESGRAFLHLRDCFFCDFKKVYEDFPDDSRIINGIVACADCLKNPKIARTIQLMENAERIEVLEAIYA